MNTKLTPPRYEARLLLALSATILPRPKVVSPEMVARQFANTSAHQRSAAVQTGLPAVDSSDSERSGYAILVRVTRTRTGTAILVGGTSRGGRGVVVGIWPRARGPVSYSNSPQQVLRLVLLPILGSKEYSYRVRVILMNHVAHVTSSTQQANCRLPPMPRYSYQGDRGTRPLARTISNRKARYRDTYEYEKSSRTVS
eukprot:scaffold72507_cov47-Prasinocladus_malaysianus.AAC.1